MPFSKKTTSADKTDFQSLGMAEHMNIFFRWKPGGKRKKNEPSRDIFTQDEAILSGFYHHLLLLQQSKFKLYMKHKNSWLQF